MESNNSTYITHNNLIIFYISVSKDLCDRS